MQASGSSVLSSNSMDVMEREAIEALANGSPNWQSPTSSPERSPSPVRSSGSKKRKYSDIESDPEDDELQQDKKRQCSSNSATNFPCPVPSCHCCYTRRYDMKVHFLSKHKDVVHEYPHILQIKKSSKDGKKWQCPFSNCNCGYSRKGDLKAHLTKKHPSECDKFPEILRSRSTKKNKKFQCPVASCQCGYKRKFDLKGHILSKHPDISSQYLDGSGFFDKMSDEDSQIDENSATDSPSPASTQPSTPQDSPPRAPVSPVPLERLVPSPAPIPVYPSYQFKTSNIVIPIASRANGVPKIWDFAR